MGKYIKEYFMYLKISLLILAGFILIIIALFHAKDIFYSIVSVIIYFIASIFPDSNTATVFDPNANIVDLIISKIVDFIKPKADLITSRIVDSIILGISVFTIITTLRGLESDGVKFSEKKESNIDYNAKENKKFSNMKDSKIILIGIITSILYYILINVFFGNEKGKVFSDTLAIIAFGILLFRLGFRVFEKHKENEEDEEDEDKEDKKKGSFINDIQRIRNSLSYIISEIKKTFNK